MISNKKYLIASGCSFTEGHHLKENGSWATFLGKEYNLEVINLGKGGAGNQYIFSNIIQFSKIQKNIADNAIFGIQLSECLRLLVTINYIEKNLNKSLYPKYWHITPNQFFYEETFNNWDLSLPHTKFIYDNRYCLAPFFSNVTHALLTTYNSLISFIDFCNSNNYPYFVFDGLTKNIPEKVGEEWFLKGDAQIDNIKVDVIENIKSDFDFFKFEGKPVIHMDIIKYLNSIPNYFNDITYKTFLEKKGCEEGNANKYFLGNDNHPNELGSKLWCEYLKIKLLKLF